MDILIYGILNLIINAKEKSLLTLPIWLLLCQAVWPVERTTVASVVLADSLPVPRPTVYLYCTVITCVMIV